MCARKHINFVVVPTTWLLRRQKIELLFINDTYHHHGASFCSRTVPLSFSSAALFTVFNCKGKKKKLPNEMLIMRAAWKTQLLIIHRNVSSSSSSYCYLSSFVKHHIKDGVMILIINIPSEMNKFPFLLVGFSHSSFAFRVGKFTFLSDMNYTISNN